jgi:hypothetical protein
MAYCEDICATVEYSYFIYGWGWNGLTISVLADDILMFTAM